MYPTITVMLIAAYDASLYDTYYLSVSIFEDPVWQIGLELKHA